MSDPHDPAPLAVIRLSDYTPPPWLVESVALDFALDATATRVRATLQVRRNPDAAPGATRDFVLNGRGLKLVSAAIDGASIAQEALVIDAETLTAPAALIAGDAFEWRCETQIDPKNNIALEGLYMSRDMFCTQCEAQGFRKITYYPDRPDVMARFDVRIEADKAHFPTLLSNGDPIDQGDLPEGRHYVVWRDPFPKPSYLFALVGGDLVADEDHFTTASGREVLLQLYTRKNDVGKTAYALDSLKRSMAWDERAYGREYDLDRFMIVAVDDFNMGAMENKGLNIFNSKFVLANEATATDTDFENIESIVAHEYFHNWTGNRITCRDWFQLCLKEGLTVFRDQQFSEAERSASVIRIDSIAGLRSRQFREDAGPLAHPPRPEEYAEINNFYTTTVYEKGAEIVRMLHTLLGAEGYRAALDLYFERHDGEACTIEQFLQCFIDSSGRDLSAFHRWWSQAGTPRVAVAERFDPASGAYHMALSQRTAPTPGQPEKGPQFMPIVFGLLDEAGAEIEAEPKTNAALRRAPEGWVLEMTDETAEIRLEGLPAKPHLSFNRGFSAPIIVERKADAAERAFLLAHDRDFFIRWDAGRSLAVDAILDVAADLHDGKPARAVDGLLDALATTLGDESLEPAYRAQMLITPGEDELAGVAYERAQAGLPGLHCAEPDAINAARIYVRRSFAERARALLEETRAAMAVSGPFDPSAGPAGRRALANAALGYLTLIGDERAYGAAYEQFMSAANMTDEMASLTFLAHSGAPTREAAIARFYERWRNDPLVLGKWFAVQATSPLDETLGVVDALTRHPAFEWRNPNKFRALIGSFAMGNPINFHRVDGAGYHFVADWLIKLDAVNPQTAARLISAFETWRRYDERRQAMMRAELSRIAGAEGLSRDSQDMAGRILNA